MGNTKPYLISVLEPCAEGWGNMTTTEQGRFCSTCQKTVTDFTGMRDAEIIRYFLEHKNLCGRFTSDQLDRPLQPAILKARHWLTPVYRKLAAGLLLTATTVEHSFAQQKKMPLSQQTAGSNVEVMKPVISGKLLDAFTNKPLVGKRLLLNRDTVKLETVTDIDGKFVFLIPIHMDTLSFMYATADDYDMPEINIIYKDLQRPIILYAYRVDTLESIEIVRKSEALINGGAIMYSYQVRPTPLHYIKMFWYQIRVALQFKKRKGR